jgi:hypothetical protein
MVSIRETMPSPITGMTLPLATLTSVWADVFSDGTCLESQVICSVAPESIIHVLFITEVEVLSALQSLPVAATMTDALSAIWSESVLVSAIEARDLLHRGSQVLSQFSGYPINSK